MADKKGLIIAKSRSVAAVACEGLTRVASSIWVDGDGNRIYYVSEAYQLLGLDGDIPILVIGPIYDQRIKDKVLGGMFSNVTAIDSPCSDALRDLFSAGPTSAG